MHPVLLLDEVFRIILDHVERDLDRLPALKTFYYLATVCRAWKDPALDYLWASLASVDPLLALLPHVSVLLVTNLTVLTTSAITYVIGFTMWLYPLRSSFTVPCLRFAGPKCRSGNVLSVQV